MKFSALAVSGLALSAFLSMPVLAQNRVDANGMPTTDSTPQEKAATADLNAQIGDANVSADQKANAGDAQYQAQQQQYQNQLQQNQQAQQDYQLKAQDYAERTARYESLRARYAAERAHYHRDVWPGRYARFTLEEFTPTLIGQRVEIINGDRVGTVTDVARTPAGRVEALMVRLDSNKLVWIDRDDIRYDRADGVVMTNLARGDLGVMADERI